MTIVILPALALLKGIRGTTRIIDDLRIRLYDIVPCQSA
jgi:hypothetical protein